MTPVPGEIPLLDPPCTTLHLLNIATHGNIDVRPVASLSAATQFMAGASELPTQSVGRERICLGPVAAGPDLTDVKGQALAKRAVLIAAGGNHNLLMLYSI